MDAVTSMPRVALPNLRRFLTPKKRYGDRVGVLYPSRVSTECISLWKNLVEKNTGEKGSVMDVMSAYYAAQIGKRSG